MSYEHKDEYESPVSTNPPPTADDLGIFGCHGHAVYGAGGGATGVTLAVDRDCLRKIWKDEVKNSGIPFDEFSDEFLGQGTQVLQGAASLYLPFRDALQNIPGNVRVRFLRICVCWRWICVYVWVKI